MAVSSTWILSLKILLISTGMVSIAIMLKIYVLFITDCVFYQIPLIWAFLVSLLRPPYLYFVINGIIITIAATSRFHHKADNKSEPEPLVSSKPPPSDLSSDYAVPPQPEFGIVTAVYENETNVSEVNSVVINGPEDDEGEDPLLITRSTWTPPEKISTSEIQSDYLVQSPGKISTSELQSDYLVQSPEKISTSELQSDYLVPSPGKPLVSSRFGHRKPLKASPEGGRSLRVAKPKRQETLESTWKAITDGRHVPLTRHLKKLDTLENQGRQFDTSPQEQYFQQQIMKKSEMFQDSTNHGPPSANSSPGLGKLRKEPSLSQDELNRRVEAFIKKFNEEMRLQRQQSLNQYVEMINRGAH